VGGVVGRMCNSRWEHTVSTDKQQDALDKLCASDMGMMADDSSMEVNKGASVCGTVG